MIFLVGLEFKMNKVLIVDDEKLVRWFIERSLLREGYETDTAANGEEALNKLEEGSYNILITDLRMPVMSGVELLKKLREEGRLPFTIVTSAYLSEEAMEKVLEAGVSKCIRKPFKIEEILDVIKSYKLTSQPSI